MLNNVTLMGRLTRNPELRYTQSQIPVASFTLACDRDFGGRDGEKQTDFIDCTAWRHAAEFVNKYFSKGSMAVVKGRLEIRDWTDKDGNKRRNAEVNVDAVYFGESKRRAADDDERAPMPDDSDAPPEMDNTPPRDVDALMQTFPNVVSYDDGEDGIPF